MFNRTYHSLKNRTNLYWNKYSKIKFITWMKPEDNFPMISFLFYAIGILGIFLYQNWFFVYIVASSGHTGKIKHSYQLISYYTISKTYMYVHIMMYIVYM